MNPRDCTKCVEYDAKWGCAYGLSPDDSRCVYEERTTDKKSCENCQLYRPYDPEDPDASICIHYDCFAPDYIHFLPRKEKLDDEKVMKCPNCGSEMLPLEPPTDEQVDMQAGNSYPEVWICSGCGYEESLRCGHEEKLKEGEK